MLNRRGFLGSVGAAGLVAYAAPGNERFMAQAIEEGRRNERYRS
ncbi:twin-arginine translocation signal domain-containing protein [Kitasatospora sp. NPDC101155]